VLIAGQYRREPPESKEEYEQRLKRDLEARAAAEERRVQESAARKIKQEQERQQGRSDPACQCDS
jgi:hypothetical protein